MSLNVEIYDYSDILKEEDEQVVEYIIENVGDSPKTQDIVFKIYDEYNLSGDEIHTETKEGITVVEGGTYESEFYWDADDANKYSFSVETDDDVDDRNFEVVGKYTVLISDVRAALNDISEEELSDDAIEMKIKDGAYFADKRNIEDYEREKFIRAYAALKSFLVSRTYSAVNFGDVSVRREWIRILDELERELEEIASISLVIDDSHMFDERPSERLKEDGELVERSLKP